ncbi:Mft1p [Lachancea thermotolerans CBS 6340]|uniref:KLTH0D16192p n=1 Tax=Lachancea thermotolerans (strain ATCC 56472 / CBS 6340 / NRRL Y-8284) TaxID=559295 RepID=C5DFL9_LACTC|nr:KLTH0D16192p [Lachancea thermotolerans CBS 6340]CAR22974.1 KLTH0D16192p [Lachancea thermotolerans CBS 6340]
MSSDNDGRKVERRLAVYSPDTQLNTYMNAVSELGSLCFSILVGKLDEKHELTQERLQAWKEEIQFKHSEAQMYVEFEKLKVKVENESASENIEEIKRQMESELAQIRRKNDVTRQRNEKLRAMNSHIDLVNEQLEDMHRGKSRVSATREEWERQLGRPAVESLLDSNVFDKNIVKVRDGDEREELSVVSNFSRRADELKKTNDSMKKTAQRLQVELANYKEKWAHDASLFDKITEVLKDELVKRDLFRPQGKNQADEDNDEDEDEDEDDNDLDAEAAESEQDSLSEAQNSDEEGKL